MIGLLKYDLILMKKTELFKDYYKRNLAGLIVFIIIIIKSIVEQGTSNRLYGAICIALFYYLILITTETKATSYNRYNRIFPVSESSIAIESIVFNMIFFIPVYTAVKLMFNDSLSYILIFFELYALYITPYAYVDKDAMSVSSVIIILLLFMFAGILIFITRAFPEYFADNWGIEILLNSVIILSCVFNYFSIKNTVKRLS